MERRLNVEKQRSIVGIDENELADEEARGCVTSIPHFWHPT